MGLEPHQPSDRPGKQQLPGGGEQVIAGSEDTAGFPLLDPAVVDDVRALRAVLKVSQAVLGARRFSDALEIIAEHTRAALGAASLSISRWHRERGLLHTIINVGDLGPGEQRWPTDEEYPLADYRNVLDLLQQGRPYRSQLCACRSRYHNLIAAREHRCARWIPAAGQMREGPAGVQCEGACPVRTRSPCMSNTVGCGCPQIRICGPPGCSTVVALGL